MNDIDITAVRTVATEAGNKRVHRVHKRISGRADVLAAEGRSAETTQASMISWIAASGSARDRGSEKTGPPYWVENMFWEPPKVRMFHQLLLRKS